MPEISKFFGIIVRMFVEAGGSHHLAHFHSYYQDDLASTGSLRSSVWPARFQLVRNFWFLHGQSFIRTNYWRIGTSCKAVIRRLKLNR